MGKASFLLLSFICSSSLFLLCLSLSLLTDEWSFLSCSPNASQIPKGAKVSRSVMMWHGLLPLVLFTVLLSFIFQCCAYMHFVMFFHILFFSFAS